jgi:dolichol-phosphate mannosyltransferase
MENHLPQECGKPIVTFIVPARNEEENLGPLVARLAAIERTSYACEILIIDDASSDATYEVGTQLAMREPRVRILHKEKPQGIGRAIQYALPYVRGSLAIIVMADGVDPLETAVPQFCHKILKEGCDLVLLSRYTAASDSDSIPFTYKFFQSAYRFLTRYALSIRFRDTTYAFRAFDPKFVRNLGLKSGGFEISPEMTFKVIFAGGSVGEVSGRQTRRVSGKSKFRFVRAFPGYTRVLLEAFYLRFRTRRTGHCI